jgi:hypothetical protein
LGYGKPNNKFIFLKPRANTIIFSFFARIIDHNVYQKFEPQ